MAVSRKSLFQSNPSAGVLTDAYTVPASTTTVITTINVANRSATATSFSISHAVAGAADDNKQYIYATVPIAGNDTFQATTAIPCATTDKIRVLATAATLSIQAWGEELS